jgi:O-antigen ligase
LVPWCVFFCGVLFSARNVFRRNVKIFHLSRFARATQILRPILTLLLFVAIFVLLFLTKSRSGLLAAIFGIAWFAIGKILLKTRESLPCLLKAILGCVIIGIVIAGIMSGKISGELLDNATKSFGYRLQYWHSSLGMIADHPFFGCGVGNFKEFYTLYKLPTASETVSDPHNLFFETASNAGLPALIGLLALLAAAIIPSFAARKTDEETSSEQRESYQLRAFLPILLGGGIGILAAFVYSYTNYDPMKPDAAMFCLLGFGIGSLLFLPTILYAPQRLEKLAPVCLFALVVNLLAAGGIAFPHVNATFWFLLALCLNRNLNFGTRTVTMPEKRTSQKSELRFLCLAGCFFAMAAAFYPTAFLTNLRANRILRGLQEDVFQNAYLDRRIAQFENAVRIDPYRADAWTGLCRDLLAQHREFPNIPKNAARQSADNDDFRGLLKSLTNNAQRPRDFSRIESLTSPEDVARATINAVRSAPSSAMRFEELGLIFFGDYQRSRNVDSLEIAVVLFERAAALYPNRSMIYVDLAACYDAIGDSSRKRETAQRAVELDDVTPHADKKLPPEIREQAMRFLE